MRTHPTGDTLGAKLQHEVIGVKKVAESGSFRRTEHPDAQWFGDAGLGLFIHWGLSSVTGHMDLSWGMIYGTIYDSHLGNENKLAPEQYFALADQFNPDKYDPDKWLRAAAAAGFRYAVMTTKHHEGYALWPSNYGSFSTRTHLGGRDLVQPYIDACRANGLKVGLYYSPPDWYYNRSYMSFHYGSISRFPERRHFNTRWEPIDYLPEKPSGFDDEYKAFIRGQVEELLTRYGKIDILFFDGGPEAISFERIRELQPGIVVNTRMHGYGDYQTPEGELPKANPSGWWELCESWTDAYNSWGYHVDEQYESTAWMLSRFSKVRSWGGNYLVNVGPRANGELPEIYYERLEELRQWMAHNKESVFGASGGPYPDRSSVPVTIGNGCWYLHVLPDIDEPVKVTGIDRPRQVRMLQTGRDLEYSYGGGTLVINIPRSFRTGLVDVVSVVF